jgi:peroxiredoxin
MAKILPPGTKAPDFTLNVTPDQTITLEDYRGRPVILLFYPADWSPVCSDEIAIFNELVSEFRKHQAELVGISVDSHWCHCAFAKHCHIHFPLLADFEPKGTVAKQYGVYREKAGVCERALFLIDKEGTIVWCYLSPIGENPGADGALEALEKLTAKEKSSANNQMSHSS